MSIIELAGNLNDMEEYEPLPDGLYPAQAVDCELRHSEKVPQGYLFVTFRVSPDHFPADYDVANAPEGVSVPYARCALPDPSNRRTVRPFRLFMEAIGLKVKDKFDANDIIGREAQLLLKRNEYMGALVNNIEAVQPLPTV
jgi:hypothetical protein